ncbi:unnamed protein product [Rotaria sordida]|uniref:F-box domain-containing protein n=1 Tax=Rotaria sordida TaxID=392033 RepID=A0A819EUB5_9BILA|nr:unnamed protein product [Rotaria sordida]CAF3856785.1 unnamed protein product [Rotaria sordida]
MEHSIVQLMDLPNELIMIILNKLDNSEVLYSLMDVNTRLNQIVHDPTFTTKITLTKSDNLTTVLPDIMLDRFCLQILPKICHSIKWLNLESSSMERILLAADYPNLRQLDIFINDQKCFLYLNEPCSSFSSTLVELYIDVYLFDDCLYLLDGRFDQLRTLFVNVCHILPLRSTINTKNELANLKCFSLISNNETYVYDEVVVPNLRRMSNLEKLSLHLVIECKVRFIDGTNLKKNIIIHMPNLNEFTFNIRSIISINDHTYLLSNEYIQRTLTNLTDHQVISCVDYFPSNKTGQCHFYTYPHTMLHYDNITNNFPGGLFEHVRSATLFDESPFEHTFFIRIAQAFPFLNELIVSNCTAQNEKLNNDSEYFPIIKYPHLTILRLIKIHDDYAEELLLDIKTCFSNFIVLSDNTNQNQRLTCS